MSIVLFNENQAVIHAALIILTVYSVNDLCNGDSFRLVWLNRQFLKDVVEAL